MPCGARLWVVGGGCSWWMQFVVGGLWVVGVVGGGSMEGVGLEPTGNMVLSGEVLVDR